MIAQREEMRTLALVEGRYDEVAAIYDDRLVYTHSTGARDDKATTLGRLMEGTLRYEVIDHDLDHIEVVGDTALVTGRLRATVVVAGGRREIESSTSMVWTRPRQGGAWIVLIFHSSPAPSKESR
ncbi:nuclear transport factor 2 family protein [Nocardia sp. NPDC101769]|uniref:nuclear transport factor 2 family protein n=1 Tax=Nocardia sp. NPDC101769 TaxID=3364333 RepID=UPI00381DE00A